MRLGFAWRKGKTLPLESGALLAGRYRIDQVLGRGGFGAVYLAPDESLGVPCAVKENLSPSPEPERQFRREATLLADLCHAYLPRVTNHFILDGQQYLIMDFVEGEDLKQRLAGFASQTRQAAFSPTGTGDCRAGWLALGGRYWPAVGPTAGPPGDGQPGLLDG